MEDTTDCGSLDLALYAPVVSTNITEFAVTVLLLDALLFLFFEVVPAILAMDVSRAPATDILLPEPLIVGAPLLEEFESLASTPPG